ncbi:MAG: FMN-binding protein [Cellulomonas sp.]|nr:FMN-binding protein [Cellulomonas sp.]
MSLPWRGTLLYSGALAAVAVAVTARFAGAEQTTTADAAGTATSSATATATSTPTATASASATPTASASATTQTGTSSGTSDSTTTNSQVITGDVVSTRYGNVQVAVTFTDGVISSVATLQAPSGHESSQINAYATPILAQEAVAANSANIDTVSGATFTSQAYAKSLQSAIDQLG